MNEKNELKDENHTVKWRIGDANRERERERERE